MTKPTAIHDVNSNTPYWTLLVYADPGVGKTYLAGTSARADHDTLIVRSPQDHTDTIAIHLPEFKVDEWIVKDWSDLDEVHEYLRHEDHGYRWVWLDCLSLIQEVGLDGIMRDLVENKPHRNVWAPDKGEYGQNMTRLRQWISDLVGLQDFNLGMTAHVIRYTFDTTGEELMMPWIQGKLMPEKISAYANVVGHLDTVDTDDHGRVRVLHTQTHDEFYAKDGFGAFGERIVRPTIPKMEQAVAKAKDKGKKEAGKKTAPKRKKPARKRTAAASKK